MTNPGRTLLMERDLALRGLSSSPLPWSIMLFLPPYRDIPLTINCLYLAPSCLMPCLGLYLNFPLGMEVGKKGKWVHLGHFSGVNPCWDTCPETFFFFFLRLLPHLMAQQRGRQGGLLPPFPIPKSRDSMNFIDFTLIIMLGAHWGSLQSARSDRQVGKGRAGIAGVGDACSCRHYHDRGRWQFKLMLVCLVIHLR